MAPPKSSHPPAAQPSRIIFDPWNSSATGHQRAENCLANGTAWRTSRTRKLAHQYHEGAGGGERIYDSVGAWSLNHKNDGRQGNGDWEDGASGSRGEGWGDVREMLLREGPKVGKKDAEQDGTSPKGEGENEKPLLKSERRKLFQNLRVYINGSTAPMVGDHKLKQLLTENGAGISIALGRRSVTHVILGTPNGCRNGPGAGGGLAASKIQKEIKRVGGCGVKYVGVEWYVKSSNSVLAV